MEIAVSGGILHMGARPLHRSADVLHRVIEHNDLPRFAFNSRMHALDFIVGLNLNRMNVYVNTALLVALFVLCQSPDAAGFQTYIFSF